MRPCSGFLEAPFSRVSTPRRGQASIAAALRPRAGFLDKRPALHEQEWVDHHECFTVCGHPRAHANRWLCFGPSYSAFGRGSFFSSISFATVSLCRLAGHCAPQWRRFRWPLTGFFGFCFAFSLLVLAPPFRFRIPPSLPCRFRPGLPGVSSVSPFPPPLSWKVRCTGFPLGGFSLLAAALRSCAAERNSGAGYKPNGLGPVRFLHIQQIMMMKGGQFSALVCGLGSLGVLLALCADG